MVAVILAGGKGKRLKPLTADRPKPMVPIGDKPILEHHLNHLQRYRIKNVIILTGYMGEAIDKYLADNANKFDMNISCIREETPLGTAGAVKQLDGKITTDFLLIYGDVLFDVMLSDFLLFHQQKKGIATLAVHPSDHPYDSDLVETDETSLIHKILPKPHHEIYYKNLCNAALYLLAPKVFDYIPASIKTDFMADIFPEILAGADKLYAYKTAEYIKDMGTHDRLEIVDRDFRSGKVNRFSKEKKRPAIFIDRDGTLIREIDWLHKIEDLELFDFSASAIRAINQTDYLSILVTNQSVIARNICDIKTLDNIHKKLETLIGKENAYLSDIFYCPHHPDKGFHGENPDYKIDCSCRKPKTGMIDTAAQQYNIDLSASWIVGDSTIDIKTGVNAGLKTILVRTGKGGKDNIYPVVPDFIFNHIEEAISFITRKKRLLDQAAQQIFNLLASNNESRIILIGGPSRSGKSTFVKCLADCFATNNISIRTMNLDNWLIGESQRSKTMTVRERYQYNKAAEDLKKLLNGEIIPMPLYNPYTREVSKGPPVGLNQKEYIILEGVPALDIEELRALSQILIYYGLDEMKRKQRFVDFYRWKNMHESGIEQLYHQRMKDEIPIIEATRKFANVEIREDGAIIETKT